MQIIFTGLKCTCTCSELNIGNDRFAEEMEMLKSIQPSCLRSR
jgi:hypothetical protein